MSDASRSDWAFQLKPRRDETEAERLAFENHPRRKQDKENRTFADAIYRRIFGGEIDIQRLDALPIATEVQRATDVLGVDYYIRFPNETLLAGQEKFLSASEAKYRTLTISIHSWSRCVAQVYFCGYLLPDGTGFHPWVIANWPATMLATLQGRIKWQLRGSITGFKPFWWTPLDTIPRDCIIASEL